MIRKILKYVAWTLGVLVVVAIAATLWAYQVATTRYEKEWKVHDATFPIPFPMPDATPEVALARAVERGRHLVESRAVCSGCHAKDMGGGTIIDVAIVGHWVAPNLTTGKGSVTKDFTANDWDRAVRHGVRHNGRTSSMPSGDFANLSDRELSDIVAYIRSLPPVDRDMGQVRLGPVFAFVIATDPSTLVAYSLDHDKPHAVEPPPEAPSVALGDHIAQVCRGCHGPNLSGGKLAGDPDMPIVANLTPDSTGLADWTEADFFRALREGKRKDGTAINPQMPWQSYGRMSDTEIKAVWAYLRTVPPRAKGNH
jgi:mono/diheme cytochrome c family protein